MLTKQQNTDKFGGTVISYQITQGDTFPMLISLRDDAGEIIPQSLINKVVFKLGDTDRIQVFTQEFVPTEDGKYKLEVSGTETALWAENTKYFYEVEATFTDTFNTTPLSYTSTIYVLPQIKPAE